MSKLRPYLAVDLETTGLNTEKSHILQIGWIIDDGVSPREQLEKGSVIVKEPVISYGEFFALGMNGWLFQEMSKKEPKYPVFDLSDSLAEFILALEKTSAMAEKFDQETGESKPSKRVQLAGKNVSNFDWPLLKNWICRTPIGIGSVHGVFWDDKKLLPMFVDHRFMDVGALFVPEFGRNPGFDKINKLIGWKDINHDAVDDAMNVVVAVRYKMGMQF